MDTQWDANSINIFMDISTYCNAGCPQCHRTNPNGLQKKDWLPLVQWSLADFKKAFSVKTMRDIKRFHFCGTFGDPMMAKDILEIVKYIIARSDCDVLFDTNGGMRNEDFWWDISVVGDKRLTIRFDVDGINQEMHSHYRRFTELHKVLEHMSIVSSTNAKAISQTIVFKHNAQYKDEIKALVEKHGSSYHQFIASDRFGGLETPVTHHTDENGNPFTLEAATDENLKTHRDILEENIIEPGRKDQPLNTHVQCAWAKPRNEVIISYDGQVLPCCYHQNSYHRKFYGLLKGNEQLYTDYQNDKLKHNVLYRPLREILEDQWYKQKLPYSIENNPMDICVTNCGKKI